MDGEIWDEERWEAFLRETDRQVERYMTLLFRFMSEDPPAGKPGSNARRAWDDRLRIYLLSNGIRLRPEDSLPRHWAEPDEHDADGSEGRPTPFDSEEGEDLAADLKHVGVYLDAQQLASRVLNWSNTLPGRQKDSTFVQFCSHITQVPANLAKGHGIGYEIDVLGGNIACTKRALSAANAALDLLKEMRHAVYMTENLYRSMYEEAFNVRNDVGVYVQDLRARFNLGVD